MTAPTLQVPARAAAIRLAGPRHGAGLTLALHLGPGVAFTVAALLLARRAAVAGVPPVFGLYAATLLVLVPVQVGLIAVAAKGASGSWRLRGALRYTSKIPWRRLVVMSSATLAWAALVFVLTAGVAETIRTAAFSWWPGELNYAAHLHASDAFPRSTMIVAWMAGLLVTSITAPVVEELYFRGFLLPRLEHLGGWAPVVNTILFAVYHLWSPWQAPTRFLATLPLFYATWRTRAVTLAIVVHVALNVVGDTLASIPVVFG